VNFRKQWLYWWVLRPAKNFSKNTMIMVLQILLSHPIKNYANPLCLYRLKCSTSILRGCRPDKGWIWSRQKLSGIGKVGYIINSTKFDMNFSRGFTIGMKNIFNTLSGRFGISKMGNDNCWRCRENRFLVKKPAGTKFF